MHKVKREFYPSGRVKVERYYRNGLLDGLSKFYSEDGTLWATQHCIDGIRLGLHFNFKRSNNSHWPL